jgi:predicted membrane-bound spermidine synthase
MTMVQKRLINITIFISGMTSLGVEMAASRLLGNVFGSSNVVWASIIGLILIYLTVGYFIGGKFADRYPRQDVFYQILLWASLSTALIPLISSPLMRLAADAFDELNFGVLAGSFVTVMVLMVIPMILLGMASPFAIRLSIDEASRAGKVSGQIYAISTIGSFAGSFLPVLLLIPMLGTYRTFYTFSLLLTLTALAGLSVVKGFRFCVRYLWMPLVIIALFIFGTRGSVKKTIGQIYETESAYNYIQVLQVEGYNLLRLNDGQGVHSIYKPGETNYYGPWEQFLVGPFFNKPPFTPSDVQSMAIVGLAAGTAVRGAVTAFGEIPIDGIEIDPKIVEVGRQFFDMNLPNLNVLATDGRWGLSQSTHTYDLIAVDAYRPPYIPAQLTTAEFFAEVKAHLTPQGVVVINVGRAPKDRRLINSLASTLKTSFPSVHVMDIPDTFNSMLFATNQPTTQENFSLNYRLLTEEDPVPDLLLDTMAVTLANLKPDPEPGIVFTDDRAPVEWITNDMVIRFIFSGGVSSMRSE